jgi:hypothetical protein
LATEKGQFVGLPILGVIGIGVCPGAGSVVEIMLAEVVDQVAKLLLAASEEVVVAQRRLQLIRPAVAGWFLRVSWEGPGAPA